MAGGAKVTRKLGPITLEDVEDARAKWLKEQTCAPPYSGSPTEFHERAYMEESFALIQRLQADYDLMLRRYNEQQTLKLQKSLHRATWASFAVALTVGLASIAHVIVTLWTR